MKRSIVPAQITTVEDRVLGNLTPYQAALISLPLVFGVVFYAMLPPHFHLKMYKVGIIAGLELIGAILSIRVNDQMLIFWLITRLKYNMRPRYYIYDKNDAYLRNVPSDFDVVTAKKPELKTAPTNENVPAVKLSTAVRLQEIMADERVNLRFKTTKGRLNVVANEIK